MLDMIQIPTELACFELPQAVQERLQLLLDQQDSGVVLSTAEHLEAESLVEIAEFLSLLKLRAQQMPQSA